MPDSPDVLSAFIQAGCAPLTGGHASGSLDEARTILAAHPDLAETCIYAAAILGDEAAVRAWLARDFANATRKGGPHGWDALTHLCFSRFLRLDPARSGGFVRAAEALLDAGADPNAGWQEEGHQPGPARESVLYGAAGVARHPGLTRLLLERGADPNDGEVTYHAPEGWDQEVLQALTGSGRLTGESLAAMLIRKADWHDYAGIRWLLEHGASPNRLSHWGWNALHQAVRRDNELRIVELMLEHGADPSIGNGNDGASAAALAARRGRGDVLELLERRGLLPALQGADRLAAACARDDEASVRALAAGQPSLVSGLLARAGEVLALFAGHGNTSGVRQLLDLGADVRARFAEGDGYFGIAKDSAALHVAAWRARHATVRLLLERGAPVNEPDGDGRTPLMLAVLACVDSYWADRRSPESVEALLRAGASPAGVPFPSGYTEVDRLLRSHGASGAL